MAVYDETLLKEVQKVVLEIAKFFVDFCEKNHLLCYFCGGGCIGAIRHKGFVPWDDDLDFFLPRDDYERLKKIWNDTDRYAMLYPSAEYNDHSIYISIRDKKTTQIKPVQAEMDIPHGVAIDVFPLDGCPDRKISRAMQLFWGLVYQLFGAQLEPVNHGKMVRWVGKLLLGLVRSPYSRYSIWKYAEKKMSRYAVQDSKYVTELCAGPRYMKLQYPKQFFEQSIMVPFEDTEMPVPVGYDGYLKMAFGDYMVPPPVEERIPSHEAFIDLEKPYTAYRGIKYCTNESQTQKGKNHG